MAEYTDIYCNSPKTAQAVKAYLDEQLRQDEERLLVDSYVEKSTLRITYKEDDCPQRIALDAQMVGYRDGYDSRTKS